MQLKSAPQVKSTVGLTVVLHYSVARISEMKNMFCTVFGLKQSFFYVQFYGGSNYLRNGPFVFRVLTIKKETAKKKKEKSCNS